ncbi:MAG: hypothetical protein ACOYOU_03965 [Kiritimatiellia bacterium]
MPICNPTVLEERLNEFDPRVRRDSLEALLSVTGRQPPGNSGENVNMHCHSFFSYHASGWSPARIAWACHRQGLYAAALCDFDVLDGLDEFLRAGLTLGLRTAVHLETRAFVSDMARLDINSPGEPGVAYIMGAGFVSKPATDTPQGRGLTQFREGARIRNEALINRINEKLPAIRLQYAQDVLPLTPLGVATERHIIRAYAAKGRQAFADSRARAAFWAPLLKRTAEECQTLEGDDAKFEEAVRGALAKRGGIGYTQPDASTFPPVEEFIAWVSSCEAIPTIAWLDGTSTGEADCRALLGLLRDKGCGALNIIPDRNWNIAKPQERDVKVAKLHEIVRIAADLDLPINIGTEMNRLGLPFADELEGPVLRQHGEVFLQGAQIMVGHTLLARYAAAPYLGARAEAEFPRRKARNRFYANIGATPPLTHDMADGLLDAGPERAFALLADAAKKAH